MYVLKNTFGVSVGFVPKLLAPINFIDKLAGSTLNRKPKTELTELMEAETKAEKNAKRDELDPLEKLLEKPLKLDGNEDLMYKRRFLSPRSKSKIRKKVIAFSRLHSKLSFVTLTFLNKVTDRQAIKALGAFLDNVSKRSKDFQYLWVAEKQTKNEVFKENIHFHLITNKYWDINKWWNYWLDVQKNLGIAPRDENFKPSSAFDVKVVHSNNIKGVGNYITKYISKNTGEFRCMIWNCSRKISKLYTDFYSDTRFLEQLRRIETKGALGGTIKTYKQEHCDIHLIPLNQTTNRFYTRIDVENRLMWNNQLPNENKNIK